MPQISAFKLNVKLNLDEAGSKPTEGLTLGMQHYGKGVMTQNLRKEGKRGVGRVGIQGLMSSGHCVCD